MSLLGRVWKDPVGSKLIASAILFVLGIIYTAFNYELVKCWVTNLYSINVSVIYVFLSCVLTLIVIRLLRFYNREKISKEEEDLQKIVQFNKFRLTNLNITLRWKVYFQAGHPVPNYIKAYCTMHKPPVLIDENSSKCPFQDCLNHKQTVFNIAFADKFIATHLDAEWYRLKGE